MLLISAVAGCCLTTGVATAGLAATGGLGDRTVALGSTYTISGQTGTLGPGVSRAAGRVTLSGRWDGGRPQVLAQTTTTADGRFRLIIHLTRHGKLDLSLATPDRRVAHVVLTVI